jgi:hypothetical protein
LREIEMLEAVQKKAVGMVSGLTARTYEDRCKELKIQTLAERRHDQDLTQVFRLTKEIGGLRLDDLFERIPVREGPVTRLARNKKKLICSENSK